MADCVCDFELASVSQASRDNVLGHPARKVSRRTVDLRRILAGKSTTTVTCPTTIGVDDDLAAGQSRVALRATNHKASSWIDQIFGLVVEQVGRQHLADHLFDTKFLDRSVFHIRRMLGGNHHVFNSDGLSIDILKCHLAFYIGTQPRNADLLALARHLTEQAVCIHNRRGHQLRRLIAGIAEHDTLVTGALLRRVFTLGSRRIDPLRDVRGLRGQNIGNKYLVRMKDIIVVDVANVTDRVADDLFVIELRTRGDFASQKHAITFDQSLASHAALWVLFQAGVQNAVGNVVGDFIGMALAHRFG